MMRLWCTVSVVLLLLGGCGTRRETQRVTVYVSEDQVFSQPVLEAFEKETGITVDAVYDTEEAKSTGVMNRLIAEKAHPRADVYWANEPVRAEVLRQRGVLEPYRSPEASDIDAAFRSREDYWTGFSARLRVFIVHKGARAPASVFDYADDAFAGKGVIANPLFGTTTVHVAALYARLGTRKADAFLRQLKRNGTAISTGNGESADFVARGTYDFALVDSDDAISRIRRGDPVRLVYPDQQRSGIGMFVVPNAVMLIDGAPHPKAARRLIDFLLSKQTEAMLANEDCAQIPLHDGVAPPPELHALKTLKTMDVDYEAVAAELTRIQPRLGK